MADAAVLIDMDGLLVDTEPLWMEVERSMAAGFGWRYTAEDHTRLVGVSLTGTARYLIDRAQEPVSDTVETVAGQVLAALVRLVKERGVRCMEGACTLLNGIRLAELPYALVTSSHPRIVHAVLDAAHMQFGVIVHGKSVARHKPRPEPYLMAARRLGVLPARCVALEDSPGGVESAERAGCRVIAVPSDSIVIPPAPGRIVVPSLVCLDADSHGISVREGSLAGTTRSPSR